MKKQIIMEDIQKKDKYLFSEENHVHTLNGSVLIGTSSMSSVLNKPGLTYWASSLAVAKFGWINKGNKVKGWTPKEKRLDSVKKFLKYAPINEPEEWLNLCDEAYSAHSTKLKDSAKGGTDLHEECEKFVKNTILCKESGMKDTTEYDSKIQPFIDWSHKNVKKFLVSEGHCYSKEYWLGGIIDCIYEDMEGKLVILDFKSSKEVYLSQFWQCIGYAIQIEENGVLTKEGELILKLDKPIDYVAVLPFGMPKPDVQFNYDMDGGKKAVEAMVLLYKKLN